MEKFKKEIIMLPAYDGVLEEPKKDYGIGGMRIHFQLKGKKGGVSFVWSTAFLLPETRKRLIHEHKNDEEMLELLFRPMGADISYHSPTPLYEGQEARVGCELLDGKPCYNDGSILNAENYADLLVRKGTEALWEELIKYYNYKFNGIDYESYVSKENEWRKDMPKELRDMEMGKMLTQLFGPRIEERAD